LSELAAQTSLLGTAIARGHQPSVPEATSALAAQANGHLRLERAGATFVAVTEWDFPSAAAEVAHRLIEDLDGIDPRRLRECARPECTLLFYDTTRPSTQRWHAEDPCGWHERQARHRSKATRPIP
jgi:predicted RNA-binding Zn ribbon-like protein